MPLYGFACDSCGRVMEKLLPFEHTNPACCGLVMRQVYAGRILVKMKYPLWVDRMEDIHKAQEQKGERLRMIYPKEVL